MGDEMSKSQNGWPVIRSGSDPRLRSLHWVTGKVRRGERESTPVIREDHHRRRGEDSAGEAMSGWLFALVLFVGLCWLITHGSLR